MIKKRTVFATGLLVVVAVALSRFFFLDSLEIQPWDEGMYGVRAKSVLMHGVWLDQTDHSVGGLYSSSHPPLYIWLTAMAMKAFGVTAFAVRLWSAIAGSLAVITFFLFFDDKLAGFFSALILGANAFFFSYSRQGQLDVFTSFMILTGILVFLKYYKEKKRVYLMLAGMFFGFSLMSKILVGNLLLFSVGMFLFFEVLDKKIDWRSALRVFFVFALAGFSLSLPWHVFMAVKYGPDFFDNFFLFHLVKRAFLGVESNVQRLGALFYVNQLAVLMPVSLALILTKFFKIARDHRPELRMFFFNFLISFAIFSFSRTQLRTYSLLFIPSLAAVTGILLSDICRKNEKSVFLWLFSAFFVLWSLFPFLREFSRPGTEDLVLSAAVFSLFLVLMGFFYKKTAGRLSAYSLFLVSIVSGVFTQTRLYYETGIDLYSEKFFKENYNAVVYIDDTLHLTNPQMTYYFNSADRGSDTSVKFVRIFRRPPLGFSEIENSDKMMVFVNAWHENAEIREIENLLKGEKDLRFIGGNEFYRVYEHTSR
ncbi:glycosyltransferase family 39 protein [candidate division WOR-3 bacterium]|nr:glycosyltransferase family 39 protein [candidate division WOR-3 bacterium]